MELLVNDFYNFKKVFSASFYNKVVHETLIPINISKSEFNNLLRQLYDDVVNGNYSTSLLRGKLFFYKTNGVARVVPCLNIKDESLYFYLIKMIEPDIAENRVAGTYGGWRIGNLIKKLENSEIEYVANSYNPFLWNENWKEFSKIIWSEIKKDEFEYAYKLDIANFYDNINLNILEKKLLKKIPKKKTDIVNLLIYFLENWDRTDFPYQKRTVGLPQSEFGDQSRLLANFYLQDYDLAISKVCFEENAKYFRYADDQYIFVKKGSDFKKIMFNICNNLNVIGLNVNASKVCKYSMKDLEIYYGYEIIDKITNNNEYDLAAQMFLNLKDSKVNFREDIVLKKIIVSGLDNYSKKYRTKILNIVMCDKFLLENGYFYINKIYKNINSNEKKHFIDKLISLLNTNYYNQFHYSVLLFSRKYKISELEKVALISIKRNDDLLLKE